MGGGARRIGPELLKSQRASSDKLSRDDKKGQKRSYFREPTDATGEYAIHLMLHACWNEACPGSALL